MKIGEAFVELLFQGGEQAKKELSHIKVGLKGIKEMSLETKAALLAVAYGLSSAFNAYGSKAMGLQEFGASTGLSTQKLQQWQVAAMGMGVSAEQVAGSMKNLQNITDNIDLNKGAPEGFSIIAGQVGLDRAKIKDTFYMAEKLREYAQSSAPESQKRQFLRNMGMDDGMIGLLIKFKGNIKDVKSSLIMSDREIAGAARTKSAIDTLFMRMDMITGRAIAPFAPDILNNLNRALTIFTDILKTFKKLSIEVPNFEKVMIAAGLAIGLAWAPLTTVAMVYLYLLGEMDKFDGKKFADKMALGGKAEGVGEYAMIAAHHVKRFFSGEDLNDLDKSFNNRPAFAGGGGAFPQQPTNIEIIQHFNTSDIAMPQKVLDATTQGLKKAMNQYDKKRAP